MVVENQKAMLCPKNVGYAFGISQTVGKSIFQSANHHNTSNENHMETSLGEIAKYVTKSDTNIQNQMQFGVTPFLYNCGYISWVPCSNGKNKQ